MSSPSSKSPSRIVEPFSALNRRTVVRTGFSAATAAAIAGMTFPKVMGAQATPGASPSASPVAPTWPMPTVGEVPAKTLSGTVIAVNGGEPKSFQPDFQVDDFAWPIACNVYNTLTSLDNSYNVIPELATAYVVSDDGLSITYTLNELASWHDGTPVTSLDVKYTLEKIVSEPTATASGLIGAVSHVDAPEPYTAIVHLHQPSASVIGFLSWYGVFILPAHIYEGTDWSTNPANMQPIGSGPFTFVEYKAGQSVTLKANETFFGEGPFLEQLKYSIIPDDNTQVQALLNGEVDYLPALPSTQVPTLQATPGYRTVDKTYPSPIYFGFNFKNETLANVDVRTAIAMGVNRDQILETALNGLGTTSDRFYPAVIEWASNPNATAPAFDVDGANALLDQAGFPKNGDSRFSLKLYFFTGWPEVADTATILKEQFAAIGISLELVSLEIGAWEEQVRAGDSDLAMLGGFQGPDPANLASRVGTDGTLNLWFYSNPEIDELLKQGDEATTQEARIPLYFQVQELLSQDLPIIQLVLQTSFPSFVDTLSGIWTDPDDAAASQVGMNRFTLTKIAS
ncbi:MAG: ABC transporter substrate-binding protein [Thermomicrobiales bacterium]